jgi:uncharacterized protein (DUF433 family)
MSESQIVRNQEILGGVPVFRGTRVPVRNLFDCLVRGGTVEEFLEDFPTVSFEQVHEILQTAERFIEERAVNAA